MKKYIALASLSLIILAGCGKAPSDVERLATMYADYTCGMQELMQEVDGAPGRISEVMANRSRITRSLMDQRKEAFPNEGDAITIFNEQREEFQEYLTQKASDKCGASEDIINNAMNSAISDMGLEEREEDYVGELIVD